MSVLALGLRLCRLAYRVFWDEQITIGQFHFHDTGSPSEGPRYEYRNVSLTLMCTDGFYVNYWMHLEMIMLKETIWWCK